MEELKSFIKYRLKNHSRHIVFWEYFFVITCGVGGAGIWVDFFKALLKWDSSFINCANTARSMYTFFPALTISCLADIILPDKVGRPVRMSALTLLFICLLWLIACATISVGASLVCGAVGCLVSLFVWIVAHGDDPQLSDEPETPQNALGGAENKPVPGSEGDYSL